MSVGYFLIHDSNRCAGKDGSNQAASRAKDTAMPEQSDQVEPSTEMDQKMLREEFRRLKIGAQASFAGIIVAMPNKSSTDGQRALEAKHGTPKHFAQEVVNAIGEISTDEADAAIKKYLEEWKHAK